MTEAWDTSDFIWDNNSRVFTAEAAELGIPPGKFPVLVTLTSERTGNKETFELSFIEEGGCFRYIPVSRNLKGKVHGIIIFND